MNTTFFPTLGPQQPCVFCFCEENTKHYGVAKLKLGNAIVLGILFAEAKHTWLLRPESGKECGVH